MLCLIITANISKSIRMASLLVLWIIDGRAGHGAVFFLMHDDYVLKYYIQTRPQIRRDSDSM